MPALGAQPLRGYEGEGKSKKREQERPRVMRDVLLIQPTNTTYEPFVLSVAQRSRRIFGKL
jgi:hypothetical protein